MGPRQVRQPWDIHAIPPSANSPIAPARALLPQEVCNRYVTNRHRWLTSPSSSRSAFSLVPQSQVPQFVVFTADDAIQSYTLDAINQFLAPRKNPNGCDVKMTYFTSLSFTNYTLVTGTRCPVTAYVGINFLKNVTCVPCRLVCCRK